MDLVYAETEVWLRLTKSVLFISNMKKKTPEEVKELQQELRELKGQITALETALEEKPDYGMGKGDPSITRWELDQAMLERLKRRAASLERSISRINQGTYGICKRCGRPINPDRLAVLPDTKLCIECARSDEHQPFAKI